MTDVFDAVVVGGGYAGLAAARKLTEEGCSTVVLEARDRVGGRTHTVEEAGAKVDVGGQWIGPGQDHIYALAAETDVATFPQWTDGEDVVLEDGRPLRVSGEEAYDHDDLEEYGAAVAALERTAAGLTLDRPWAAPDARALDAMTLETWLGRQLERPGARKMLATTVTNLFAAEPGSLSLLHVLFYIRSGGGWESLVNTEGGAQQDRLVGGLQEPACRAYARRSASVRRTPPISIRGRCAPYSIAGQPPLAKSASHAGHPVSSDPSAGIGQRTRRFYGGGRTPSCPGTGSRPPV